VKQRELVVQPPAGVAGNPLRFNINYLVHEPFCYFLRVENSGDQDTDVTVRIFIAPEEHEDDRRAWIEMDKFIHPVPARSRVVIFRPDELSSVIKRPADSDPEGIAGISAQIPPALTVGRYAVVVTVDGKSVTASDAVTVANVPGAPGVPTAVSGNASAVVSPTPGPTGGVPIKAYTATLSPTVRSVRATAARSPSRASPTAPSTRSPSPRRTASARAYTHPDAETPARALLAPAGFALFVGPERENEVKKAIVDRLAAPPPERELPTRERVPVPHRLREWPAVASAGGQVGSLSVDYFVTRDSERTFTLDGDAVAFQSL
jgi:hypothetical protein